MDDKIIINTHTIDNNIGEYSHLLITPYILPRYIQHRKLKDGTPIILRPIRPEDGPLQQEMSKSLFRETMIPRFLLL